MGLDIKEASSLNLFEEDVISYGGTSKVYRTDKESFCYKKYKDRTTKEKRTIILENAKKLSDVKTPNYLVTPKAIYLNDEGILSVSKLPYIDGLTGYNECHKYYNNAKYIEIFEKIIELVMKLTKKEFIITDLKISNLMWDKNFNFFAIDNDFTFYENIPNELQEFLKTNANVSRYNEIFGELTPIYNIYRLYFILARLLLSIEEYNYLCSIKINKKTIKEQTVLRTLNYFIQKNRNIPQEFKMQMRNLFRGDREITFNQNMKEELVLVLKKRINKKR